MFTHVEAEPDWRRFFVGRTAELARLKELYGSNVQKSVVVIGDRGSGKTALLKVFAEMEASLFPGSITYLRGMPFPLRGGSFGAGEPTRPVTRKALWVIDDIPAMSHEGLERVARIFASEPLLNGLLSSTHPVILSGRAALDELHLGPLPLADFERVLRTRAAASGVGDIRSFWQLVNGNALMASFAGQTIRNGLLTWEALFNSIQNFDRPGLLGPDGKPISTTSLEGKQIISDVTEVNEHLLDFAKKDPSVIYSLGSRKFEEMVAELLVRQGYEVDLTPAVKDGGFDMYAARKELLGEVLFLVECKKNSPDNKVGVHVVRALHGVVQQKRATAGVVATTSFFTRGAVKFQQDIVHQMHLADYAELQKWLRIV